MHIRFFPAEIKDSYNKTKSQIIKWCAKKDIIFRRYGKFDTKRYTLKEPQRYKDLNLVRFRGITSYAVERTLANDIDFIYPKWKEPKIENAVLINSNKTIENFIIVMKAQITAFLFHPPMFEPSIWVTDRARLLVNQYDGVVNPVKCGTPIEKPDIKTYEVDIKSKSEYRLEHKVTREQYGFLDSYVGEAFNVLSLQLSNISAEYQKEVSGIEDSFDLAPDITIFPGYVHTCGSPVVCYTRSRFTYRCPNCGHVKLSSLRPTTSEEFSAACEKYREEFNKMAQIMGF